MKPGDRLKDFIREKGYNQRDFASEISEKYSNLNKILNGHRDIYYDFICRLISKFPEIDLNWLLREDFDTNYVLEPKINYKKLKTRDLVAELEDIVAELKVKIPQK